MRPGRLKVTSAGALSDAAGAVWMAPLMLAGVARAGLRRSYQADGLSASTAQVDDVASAGRDTCSVGQRYEAAGQIGE